MATAKATKPKAEALPAKLKWLVGGNIADKRYEAGDVIDSVLVGSDAKELIEQGVFAPAGKEDDK